MEKWQQIKTTSILPTLQIFKEKQHACSKDHYLNWLINDNITSLGKGAEKKKPYFLWSFAKPPLGPPPPPYGLFTDKKISPHFFLEIESMIAKTNFTLGPIEKSIFFVQL